MLALMREPRLRFFVSFMLNKALEVVAAIPVRMINIDQVAFQVKGSNRWAEINSSQAFDG
jgi:hypothetical protein